LLGDVQPSVTELIPHMSDVPATSTPQARPRSNGPEAGMPRRIGIVVHPTRTVDKPLGLLRAWAEQRGVEIVQVPASYEQRRVAEPGKPDGSDLIVSIGGDGTTLAALRIGAMAERPVLGIACGSLGALATVSVDDVPRSLERFSRGEWVPRRFPALSITRASGEPLFALNDVALVRAVGGQVRLTAHVDGHLLARLAGDGAVVSTQLGSSGYTISAGGPLLASGLDGFVFTPLPHHGGFCPPLVIGPASELRIDVGVAFGGARLEVDGQVADDHVDELAIGLRPAVATMVSFRDQESLLAGLRRRRVILDSPRMAAEAAGSGRVDE
jgi:NAD+ kinase